MTCRCRGAANNEISDYLGLAARDHRVNVVGSPFWLPIGDPAALEAAQEVDIKRLDGVTLGIIALCVISTSINVRCPSRHTGLGRRAYLCQN